MKAKQIFVTFSFSSHLGPHHLHQSLTLRQVREYVCVVKAFVPLALALASLENIIALQILHLLDSFVPCLDSLMEFEPEVDFNFSLIIFRSHSSIQLIF